MTPDRRAGRPAPAGPGRGTPSAAIMLRIRRIAAQARAVPGFPKPSPRATLSAVWCTAWRRSACLAGWLFNRRNAAGAPAAGPGDGAGRGQRAGRGARAGPPGGPGGAGSRIGRVLQAGLDILVAHAGLAPPL